jgi:Fur family peroxide stress response transcriptional regulator
LTEIGKKHSKKRDAILEKIRSTNLHPGAQWVYDQLKPGIPDLSLATVYRNLRAFREEGVVLPVGVVYGEERFDGFTQPHPHLICTRCGKVLDLRYDDDTLLRQTAADLENTTKMDGDLPNIIIDHRKTVFYGLCSDCADLPAK